MSEAENRSEAELQRELSELRRQLAETKEAEALLKERVTELEKQGEMFQAMTDTALDAILGLDEGGEIFYANQAVESLFGYRVEEIQGQVFFHVLVPEGYREQWLSFFELCTDAEASDTQRTAREFMALKKGGVEFPLEASISLCQFAGKCRFIVICRDITERKVVEDELEDSQARYRDLLENLNDVVYNVDALGRITYVSPVVERFTAYKQADLIGQPFISFIHSDDIPAMVAEFERSLDGFGYIETSEFRVTDKDGGVIYVRSSNQPVFKDGAFIGFAGILTDISERVTAEESLQRYHEHLEELVNERTRKMEEAAEELRHSERYFRALIENARDIIAVLDAEGRMKYLSPSLERISGFTLEERKEKKIFDFLHPADLPRAMEAFSKTLLQSGYTDMVEFRWQHKDGSWHWQEAVASNLVDDPDVGGIVVNARDVTDRKKAERNLEKLNRCFLNLGPDPLSNMTRLALTGMEILEADLVQYGRLEKGLFSMFSSLRQDMGFQAFEDPEHHLCYYLLSGGAQGIISKVDPESVVFHEDPDVARYGFKSFVAFPIVVNEEPISCICIFDKESRQFMRREKDILATLARAIRIEEERWAYEESLRDFIDIASHELRHPVALITGFTATLEAQWEEMDENARQEVINAISQGGDRLNNLVGVLLDASLVERGRFSIEKSREDLGALLGNVLKEIEGRAHNNTFIINATDEIGACEVDPNRIHELMIILLDNAIKYSPDGSEIEIEVKPLREGIRVSVLDRGIGVPEKHRDRIFDRFHQVEIARYHSKPGIGLGLYLASEIVKGHGGRIWYEPREGGGSAFRFVLPLS